MNRKAAICVAVLLTMPLYMGFRDYDEATHEDSDPIPAAKTTGEDTETKTEIDEKLDEEIKTAADEIKEETKTTEIEVKDEETEPEEEKIELPPAPTAENIGSQTIDMMRTYMSQFNGRTIVNIEYEGASDSTMQTLKSLIMAHVGDDFDANIAIRDREAIIRSGYFYEAYQTFEEVPEGVIVTYHAMENPVLRQLEITGNTLYKTDDLKKLITVRRNSVLNTNTLQDNLRAIEEKYRDDGYILMKITDHHMDEDGTFTIRINEGTLEGYSVKGNNKTKDKVILREMRQKTGEPFNAKLARRSMERVYNLGFFEDVNVKMLPGVEPNAIIMEVNVKERRTGTFGVGAGYSTRDGLLGSVSISDTNFRGTGDAVSVTFEKSAEESDAHGFTFAYRRPWLDSKETAATIRYYNRTYQFYDYDTRGDLKERYMRKYTGGEVTLSRPQSEYSTNYITVRHRKDSYIRHIANGNAGDRSGAAGEEWRRANFGTTRAIVLQHVTDTRDNIYNPTTGGRVALTGEFGGLLGGDFTFQKYDIDHQQFFKAGEHSQVWAFKSAYGLGHGDLTEFNQFRVGGQNTLRGYRDDQFRGYRMILTTLEYRFPLASKVQGIFFTDWGGTWNSGFFPSGGDIYGSGGFGIALNTPLGALRLDYGRGSQGGRFHFNIGGGF